jgi:glycosyltransferase involved in cell wall biosynthesis
MNPKVSVIIPVYNTEKYLEQCIKSVKKQTLNDYEIMCIDDGSNDNTVNIIKKMQIEDSRIKLFQQEHAGSGIARNKGIKESSGKYIIFLDGDDYYIENDALECMVNACEKNDALICGSYRKSLLFNKEKDCKLFEGINIPEKIGRYVDYREFQNDYHYHNFMFNRKFIIDNKIYFPDYLRYQDPVFFLKAMVKAQKFWVIPKFLYCYRFGHQDKNKIKNNIHIILRGITDNLKIAKKYNYEILVERCIERINSDYYSYIIDNISNESIMQLSEINRLINNKYNIKPLEYIISVINNKNKNDFDCIIERKNENTQIIEEYKKEIEALKSKIDILKGTIKILMN